MFDPAEAAAELKWLQANPHFDERPATMLQFLGPHYLNLNNERRQGVRPGIQKALIDIFGDTVSGDIISRVRRAMVTGAIGIGKTTFASIAMPYMVHWTLCLRDPQDFYELLPGSRIAFMQMSTSEDQAKEVMFGDIKARIEHSPWFVDNYPYDPNFKNQIRFPKDIWILPGDSAETSFEGYNILGGILDEADSHKVTKDKDYATVGYNTIESRIESRFGKRGLIIVIGQMKKANGFAARKYATLKEDPEAHVVRMTIWESLGWDKFLKPDGSRDSFWYDTKRKQIVPTGVATAISNSSLMEIPNTYINSFRNDPEKALKDLAGIPPAVGDPFISLTHKITNAVDKWVERHTAPDDPEPANSPVNTSVTQPQFEKWFFSANDPRKRAIHLDFAYSAKGDALGMAMGYVSHMVEIEEELKPYIIFDFLLRIKAAPGTEIIFGDVRRILYHIKDDLKFKIRLVTMDGFESTDTRQQLRKKKIPVDYVSVDRTKLPYEDLREAIYEERVEFPRYMTVLQPGQTELVEIAVKELTELTDTGKKIDHPTDGSKDVADAMAGVVYTLMGDRTYRKGVTSRPTGNVDGSVDVNTAGLPGSDIGSYSPYSGRDGGMMAPIPPDMGSGNVLITLPQRLQR